MWETIVAAAKEKPIAVGLVVIGGLGFIVCDWYRSKIQAELDEDQNKELAKLRKDVISMQFEINALKNKSEE